MAPPSAAQTTTRPVVDQNEQAINVDKDTLSTWKPERRICGNAPSSMLFVDDLNPSITADALNKIFANYGEVKSIRMASDKIILAPNFAYVEFSNIESARKAYEDTEGTLIDGHPICLSFAKFRAENAHKSIQAGSGSTTMKYTVYARDEEFTLRKSQIDFDAPNFFTAYFFGEFSEGAAGATSVHVDRNPDLFALIVEYMSGYTILPLSARALPRMMDMRGALRALAEDAAFFGLSKLHAMLTGPRQPTRDLAWAGLSARVVCFEDVLRGNLPENINYTTSGLCSFDCGAVRPVIVFAQGIALKLVGNRNLDLSGRPDPDAETASYRLCLSPEAKAQLSRQPYSAFEFSDVAPCELAASVSPDARLRIDGTLVRFEHFAYWWRGRRHATPGFWGTPPADAVAAERVFDAAFPQPFDDAVARNEWNERSEFTLWGDELMFVIAARGFLAGTLQLHVKLLDVRARTRAEVLGSLRPPYLADD